MHKNKFETYVSMLERGDATLRDIENADRAHYRRNEDLYMAVRARLIRRAIQPPEFVARGVSPEEVAARLGFDRSDDGTLTKLVKSKGVFFYSRVVILADDRGDREVHYESDAPTVSGFAEAYEQFLNDLGLARFAKAVVPLNHATDAEYRVNVAVHGLSATRWRYRSRIQKANIRVFGVFGGGVPEASMEKLAAFHAALKDAHDVHAMRRVRLVFEPILPDDICGLACQYPEYRTVSTTVSEDGVQRFVSLSEFVDRLGALVTGDGESDDEGADRLRVYELNPNAFEVIGV